MNSAPLALLVEKTLATYVQYLIGLYIADLADAVNTTTPQALAIAAIPAALTVIANGLSATSIPANLPFYVALALNVIKTFAASFLGYMIALQFFSLERSVLTAAVVAAAPSALAVLKGALASRVGAPDTPNLVPLRLDPQTNAILVNEAA